MLRIALPQRDEEVPLAAVRFVPVFACDDGCVFCEFDEVAFCVVFVPAPFVVAGFVTAGALGAETEIPPRRAATIGVSAA